MVLLSSLRGRLFLEVWRPPTVRVTLLSASTTLWIPRGSNGYVSCLCRVRVCLTLPGGSHGDDETRAPCRSHGRRPNEGSRTFNTLEPAQARAGTAHVWCSFSTWRPSRSRAAATVTMRLALLDRVTGGDPTRESALFNMLEPAQARAGTAHTGARSALDIHPAPNAAPRAPFARFAEPPLQYPCCSFRTQSGDLFVACRLPPRPLESHFPPT